MTVPRRWRKSDASGPELDCVEVASDLDALQDSKNPGVVLLVNVAKLVASIKQGDLGR